MSAAFAEACDSEDPAARPHADHTQFRHVSACYDKLIARMHAVRQAVLLEQLGVCGVYGISEESVLGVFAAAFSPWHVFDARFQPEYDEVYELVSAEAGATVAEVLLGPAGPRQALYNKLAATALAVIRAQFPRLPEAEQESAANAAMLSLAEPKFGRERNGGVALSAWDIEPMVRKYVHWQGLNAVVRYDGKCIGPDAQLILSWTAAEEMGGFDPTPIDPGTVTVDGSAVEATVWAGARHALSGCAETIVGQTRAGASRDKAALAVRAAQWVLATGAEEVEARESYALDPLLLCFQGLRAAAPDTWGRFTSNAVPTRAVIAEYAEVAVTQGWAGAEWFTKVEARRKELNHRARVLHGMHELVEALLGAAAYDA